MDKVMNKTFLANEKRKWQIALRRYILEGFKCHDYAPYFGIDALNFRKWIEIQFDEELNWENFSKNWQFEHIIPVAYFSFEEESDLKLCWNFTNIKAEKIRKGKKLTHSIDVFAKKKHFDTLYEKTGYMPCKQMSEKIERIELSNTPENTSQQLFISEKKHYLDTIFTFNAYEFSRLNSGDEVAAILEEKAFLKQFE